MWRKNDGRLFGACAIGAPQTDAKERDFRDASQRNIAMYPF